MTLEHAIQIMENAKLGIQWSEFEGFKRAWSVIYAALSKSTQQCDWTTRAASEAVESDDPCDYCEFDKELCDKGGGECAFQCFKGRNLSTPAEKVEEKGSE